MKKVYFEAEFLGNKVKVWPSMDDESREFFKAKFEEVKGEFERVFRMLLENKQVEIEDDVLYVHRGKNSIYVKLKPVAVRFDIKKGITEVRILQGRNVAERYVTLGISDKIHKLYNELRPPECVR